MSNVLRAALAAAAISFALPAVAAEPTTGGNDETPTAGGAGTGAGTGANQGQDDMGRDGSVGQDGGLRQELNLDAETARKVDQILTSAREQAQNLRQQQREAVAQLRRAEQSGDNAQMKAAIDRLRGLNDRIHNLEQETKDRVMAQLSVQQQADFILWMVDEKRQLLEQGDQA